MSNISTHVFNNLYCMGDNVISPQINRLQLKDAGTWECEMEEYK